MESPARWYIINTLSGYEQKVAKAIRETAEQKGVLPSFEDIIVPVENVTELRRGKKVTSARKIFPGYILVKMALNDLTWNIVKNTPRVAGLLGGSKPLPVPEVEVNRVLKQVEEGAVTKEIEVMYDINETVKIIDGPFETFAGVIEEVDSEKKRIKVLVSIFGRSTPVELEFGQVEKLK
ncbi:transcription antitermination protein NusG [endosymbiont of Acanthamoeba sp. UWC8]|uniref:transcription termination/antitermination protein NusG n=1 Tax=endosymbiont of Acanthamoeba sp. UWC8 TaxID=86106 RepID=UPI0004D12EF4|nr:transcription termination/antitermination protein NusG [endosymbiont of Acanthamoeba sp. UWC8]AIF81276.1 transcription antitermination protein NusG [endosymbiont of Acanthamoeba sp. UWC8]